MNLGDVQSPREEMMSAFELLTNKPSMPEQPQRQIISINNKYFKINLFSTEAIAITCLLLLFQYGSRDY
jgi:hypothetical protein